jgi:bacteriocin biosynthesis cyclodehydratase domain-containing protein
MTPNTERRTLDAADHDARGAGAADAVPHQGQLIPNAPIPAAPRCGRDRASGLVPAQPKPSRDPHCGRPRLKSTVEVVLDGSRIILHRGGRPNGDVVLDGDVAVLRSLLTLSDGTRTRQDILNGLRAGPAPALTRDDLDQAIDALTAQSLFEDADDDPRYLDPAGLERYDRQLRYFGDLAAPGVARAAAQKRLEDATVTVLGLGGLGGMAATMLTVCGIGTVVGIDHDHVELSNLARQVLYSEDDLGRPKVEAAADRLGKLNARSTFIGVPRRLAGAQAVADAISGADFVVAAVDWPATEISSWVNDACFAAGIPYTSMSQHPPLVRVGPTYVPGVTGCHACQEADYRRRFPLFDAALAAFNPDSPAATYAPSCGVIGSLVANEAIAHVTGLAPLACEGRAALIDMTTLSISHEDVPRDPTCPVCGGAAVGAGLSSMRPAS